MRMQILVDGNQRGQLSVRDLLRRLLRDGGSSGGEEKRSEVADVHGTCIAEGGEQRTRAPVLLIDCKATATARYSGPHERNEQLASRRGIARRNGAGIRRNPNARRARVCGETAAHFRHATWGVSRA